MSDRPTLTLGRDGMGANATEADFEAWVSFVDERIDAACGFGVDVDVRAPRDVQSDDVRAGRDEDAEGTVREAVRALWDEWCAAGAPLASDHADSDRD